MTFNPIKTIAVASAAIGLVAFLFACGDDDDNGNGNGGDDVAASLCDKGVECDFIASDERNECITEIEAVYDEAAQHSAECGAAVKATDECFADLSCAEIEAGDGCDAELAAEDQACAEDGPPPPGGDEEIAAELCDTGIECGLVEPGERDSCISEIMAFQADATQHSEACGDAVKATDQCMANLSCPELENAEGCETELEAEDSACS